MGPVVAAEVDGALAGDLDGAMDGDGEEVLHRLETQQDLSGSLDGDSNGMDAKVLICLVSGTIGDLHHGDGPDLGHLNHGHLSHGGLDIQDHGLPRHFGRVPLCGHRLGGLGHGRLVIPLDLQVHRVLLLALLAAPLRDAPLAARTIMTALTDPARDQNVPFVQIRMDRLV